MIKLFDQSYPFPILLASTSIYRQEQLKTLGYKFEVDSADVDEDQYKKNNLSAKELSAQLAILKASSLAKKYPQHLIIGADQVCHLYGTIFSKPLTLEKAVDQLKLLQGKKHCLTTSMCVHFKGKNNLHTDETFLTMRTLSQDEIASYLKLDNPLKCAGSYMFESHGQRLFSQIQSSDPSSILGLPMMALQTILLQLANEA